MFNHPQRGMRSFEDPYTPPVHVDLHPSMSAGGLSSPSQAYYTQGMNQDLFSPTTPPHWPNSPYIPYDVSTKPSTHHTYSAESRRVQSETNWHPRSISGSGDLSSDEVRHRRQAGGDGWPSGRVVEGPPLASMPLAHSSEGTTTTLPTVRTCEPVRTGSGSSTWSWDDNAHHHQLSSASSGEHPHRTATRISNAADYASRYSTQHR
ncbi:hypothetical protein PHLCEN_2v10000 [Hermanssonia centrifuga]|uniref:Uncharacterized protein n=1 Tax=Hermanssonia centrifuga TaxID=98765 RepID=A0A2R6NQ22_9APHY|nr:hypothetical protein PHLCEN_2v10000 [Hermanssonia centrifuga]